MINYAPQIVNGQSQQPGLAPFQPVVPNLPAINTTAATNAVTNGFKNGFGSGPNSGATVDAEGNPVGSSSLDDIKMQLTRMLMSNGDNQSMTDPLNNG